MQNTILQPPYCMKLHYYLLYSGQHCNSDHIEPRLTQFTRMHYSQPNDVHVVSHAP